MKRIKRIVFILAAMLAGGLNLHAQTEDFNTWIELEFKKDISKKFTFILSPEIRLADQFNTDEILFQGKLEYGIFSFFELKAAYRMNTEVKKEGNETFYRWAFDAQAKQDIARFEAMARGRLTNYTDSGDEGPGNYFRPRLKLKYDIRGNKIEPFVSYELFRNITKAQWHKYRIDAGFTRNMGDIHRIGMRYRLHNYFTDKNSVHILGIEYRMEF